MHASSRHRLLGLMASLTMGTGALHAQVRLNGSSFLVARYRVGSTASLFAAGRVGAGMLVAGAITNPFTGYDAVVLGAGTRARVASNAGASVIVAGASATDGTSLRLYLMPAVSFGAVTVHAIAAGYRPMSGKNRAQLNVDPLIVSLRVSGGLRAGVAGVFVATDRKPPDYGLGPSAQLRVPGGVLAMELVGRARRAGPELRGTFSAAW